jgi:hypothetical protein
MACDVIFTIDINAAPFIGAIYLQITRFVIILFYVDIHPQKNGSVAWSVALKYLV